ncbi:torsin-1A-interacting protein 1-like [Clavelina lepadiformis]|uniref:torsin-1A-interacting protein 1-like n=1 Tax=Clavelina lepadiformis TaxID=159417 RepID=UPI004041443C
MLSTMNTIMPPNKGKGKKKKTPSAPKPDSSDHNGETDDSETKTSHDDAASEKEVDLKADGNNSRDDNNISVDGTLDENIGNPTNLKRCDPSIKQNELCNEKETDSQGGSEAKIERRRGIHESGNANPKPDIVTWKRTGLAESDDESPNNSSSDVSVTRGPTTDTPKLEPGQPTSPETKKTFDHKSPIWSQIPKTKQNSFKLPNFSAACVVPLAVVFAAAICFYALNSDHSAEASSRSEMYRKEMEFVKTSFPSQQTRLWQTISVAFSDHLNTTQPKQPAILLLASAENANPTAECLAQKISNAFSKQCTFQDAKLSGFELNSNSERAKYDLDEKISGYFEKGACSVVISRLEKIPAFATTTFYQFCENDNAPYKNVSIIFTVQVEATFLERNPDGLSNLPHRLWDEVVIDFLSRSLHSRDPDRMTEDMISGLMSRITPSVVWVNEEVNLRC